MGHNEDQPQVNDNAINAEGLCSITSGEKLETCPTSYDGTVKEGSMEVCRVCQCAESDIRGDIALGFLDIAPPSQETPTPDMDENSTEKGDLETVENNIVHTKNRRSGSGFVEFISPEGETFICSTDVETGSYHHQDTLINLGCSCKNDLSLAHYACALKWFVSHGSTVCEICGSEAKTVQPADFKKVMASLKDYEALRERTATGELTPLHVETNSDVDPDAIAAIRRQRLSEISLWFNLRNNSTAVSQAVTDQSSVIGTGDAVPTENPTAKWAVESTGILVATGLLTVTLAWLIAPHVGKRTAKSGLHILLGGICALAVVVFLRIIVLSRIKYGPARYWAILFVFWLLVFGIWASRTHGAHSP
ncbi:uncharacterized protein LOC143858175 [Tasmannia lanceolata]|uniref:uncharacterized protein LOC143858175 n=1 Tax=Tasmannia lanceolata TaxID=3420 RepID=UPI0040646CE9